MVLLVAAFCAALPAGAPPNAAAAALARRGAQTRERQALRELQRIIGVTEMPGEQGLCGLPDAGAEPFGRRKEPALS